MRRSFSIIVLPFVLWSGCVRANADHCGNQEGDATCEQRGGATVYCNVCIAENDGCSDQLPSDGCGSASNPGTSTTDAPSSSASSSTDAGSGPDATSNDTGDTSSSGGGVAGCGDGVVDQAAGEQCDGGIGASTCTSLGFGNGDLACYDNCIFDIRDCTDPPECGNGVQEDGEECDTQQTRSCREEDPSAYAGGQIVCAACAWSEAGCEACIGTQPAQPECDPEDDRCCAGTSCRCSPIDLLLPCRCE